MQKNIQDYPFLNEENQLINIGIGTQLDRILKLLIQNKGSVQPQELQKLQLPQKLYEFGQLHFNLIKEQIVPFINLHFFDNIVKEPHLFAQYSFKTTQSSKKNCRVDLAISESVGNKLVIVEFKYSQKALDGLLKLYKFQLQKYLCIPNAVAVVLYNLNKFEGIIITMHSFQNFSCDFQNRNFLFKFENPTYSKQKYIHLQTKLTSIVKKISKQLYQDDENNNNDDDDGIHQVKQQQKLFKKEPLDQKKQLIRNNCLPFKLNSINPNSDNHDNTICENENDDITRENDNITNLQHHQQPQPFSNTFYTFQKQNKPILQQQEETDQFYSDLNNLNFFKFSKQK